MKRSPPAAGLAPALAPAERRTLRLIIFFFFTDDVLVAVSDGLRSPGAGLAVDGVEGAEGAEGATGDETSSARPKAASFDSSDSSDAMMRRRTFSFREIPNVKSEEQNTESLYTVLLCTHNEDETLYNTIF